jgi:hypothetical protein
MDNQDPILDRLFPDIREALLTSSDNPVFGRYDWGHRMDGDSFPRYIYLEQAGIDARYG